MAFLKQLALKLNEKENEELFSSGQDVDGFYASCLKLGKKYKLEIPQRFRRTVREKFSQPSQDAFGRGPVRITIYIYPWMIERIERWAKKRRTTKRRIFFEAFLAYLNENEKYYGK
jgi:hypothetical protein